MSGHKSRPQYVSTYPNLLALAFGALLSTGLASAQGINAQQASAIAAKYCATCHSAKLHTANLVLDPAAVAQPETDAENWERVIRKLRARSMPPPGAPRPADSAYTELEHFIENGIDTAAASHPNPGKLPLLHRLSRAEY